MLSSENAEFLNGVVTVIRWGVYLALGLFALTAVLYLVALLFGLLAKAGQSTRATLSKAGQAVRIPILSNLIGRFVESDIEKAKRKMRDMGY